MEIDLPANALVILMGPSGSGKSSFAAKHFLEGEVLSSDSCRLLVGNDEADQSLTPDAFDTLFYILEKRLRRGLLTVVDATNLLFFSRKALLQIAKQHHVAAILFAFNFPYSLCSRQNRMRSQRILPDWVIRKHISEMQYALPHLGKEGFHKVYTWQRQEDLNSVHFARVPLQSNRKSLKGPFDIIGDIHGCFSELLQLLEKLDYRVESTEPFRIAHPLQRKLVFLGDLVDRGPEVAETIRFVRDICRQAMGYCVIGNHEHKLLRKLKGERVKVSSGMEISLRQLKETNSIHTKEIIAFFESLVSHMVLDSGSLVVCHAGLTEFLHEKESDTIKDHAMYGDSTGERDEYGLPVRLNWAISYRGKARVVYGHTPIANPIWVNKTLNIDTGCVFGGKLTALRYPELEIVAVAAQKVHYPSPRPFPEKAPSMLAGNPFLLDSSDIQKQRNIYTNSNGRVRIEEEDLWNGIRFLTENAIHPGALVYLPPRLCETNDLGVLSEYFGHIPETEFLFVETYPPGDTIFLVYKEQKIGRDMFGVNYPIGVMYKQGGVPFAKEVDKPNTYLTALHHGLCKNNLWETFSSDWFLLRGEVLPSGTMYLKNILAYEGAVPHRRPIDWHTSALRNCILEDPELFIDFAQEQVPLSKIGEVPKRLSQKPTTYWHVLPLVDKLPQKDRFLLPGIVWHPHTTKKVSLAQRKYTAWKEHILGLESLQRLVHKEPFYSVHECILGILSLQCK
ncbi:MAG: AAA family ATPase [Spirochaetota bacterium]